MTIDRISLGPVNCYLIRTNTGQYLVDSGPSGKGQELINGIVAAGGDPKAIKLLILTHGHSDHAGNAAWLRRKYGIPIAIHKDDSAYVKTASNEIPPATTAIARVIGGVFSILSGKTTWEAFNPNHLFDSTTNLQTFNLDGTLLEFSGHTPGSIGVLLPEGHLIVGDLMSNFKNPGLGMFAHDIQRMRQDIASLAGLGIKMIYPGHGRPFEIERIRNL